MGLSGASRLWLLGSGLRGVGHAAFLLVAAALLLAVGRPIATDDLWWHAALGRFYAAAHGPWLASDPLLYTASGPPAPSAWLFDTAVFATGQAGGFQALRALHVVLVAAILFAAWACLARASRSALAASLGTAVFAVLAAYRLVQLRPHLVTILATLLLYRLVIDDRGAPSWRRVVAAIVLLAIWANLHAAFVLGPVLLAVSLAGLSLALLVERPALRMQDRRRVLALAVVLGLGLLATLANPDAWSRYRDFLEIGRATPALALVGDEWAAVDPLRLPVPGLPPSPLAWALFWGLLLLVPVAALAAVRAWRRATTGPERRIDPALVALALAGLAAPLLAVRLLWLAILPLLLLACSARPWLGVGARVGWRGSVAFALASVLLATGFVGLGDWRTLAGPVRSLRATLATPYEPGRYFGHAVWLLEDAELEGNLFNEYYMGGFLGFWLAPRLRGSSNGTLNVSLDALEANAAIRARRGVRPGEDFLALLDRQGVDVFLGIGLPTSSPSPRAISYTTAYLEGAPGWVLAFRNLDSAVYLRDDARNRANFAALEAWYTSEGVPFDAARGFDVERVVSKAPEWAWAHGIIPRQFGQIQAMARGYDPVYTPPARDQLASLYAALGLYERAIEIDVRTLGQDPGGVLARRRLVWSLLHAGRAAEAVRAADEAPASAGADLLTREVFAAARRSEELPPPEAAARVAGLRLLGPAESERLMAGFAAARPRPWPRKGRSEDGARR